MDVFDLRNRLVDDYKRYARSFIKIADQRISAKVDDALDRGALWPGPLLQPTRHSSRAERLMTWWPMARCILARCLHTLAAGPVPQGAKNVGRAPGWQDVHFSPGDSDRGRQYFSRHGDQWRVLVSDKSRQKRDIDKLRVFRD